MRATRSVVGLILWLTLCYAAAFLGSLATGPAIPTWYAGLNKPPLTPPNWVFGPVWTLLYTLMGIAAWLVWKRAAQWQVWPALLFFCLQLALNVLWSALFFGLQNPGLALVEITALWLMILATTAAFWQVSAAAGALLLPYLAWVGFAAVLNYQLWWLNL